MIGAPTLILCYHRVNEHVSDAFHLCVSPSNFDAHLAILKQKAALVTLDDVCTRSRSPRVVITFDDGYVDNLQQAVPIAASQSAPVTVYVTTGMIGDRRGFWWDRVAHLTQFVPAGPGGFVVRIDGQVLEAHLTDEAACASARASLHRALRPHPPSDIADVLDDVAVQLGRDPCVPADARPLEPDELKTLASCSNVTIGAHTLDHALLRSQPADEQYQSIAGSKASLESELGIAVNHFAYPFGGNDSFDTTTVMAARRAGFASATTTLPGSVGSAPDPFTLRRRMVMDWSPARFRAQVLRWGLLRGA